MTDKAAKAVVFFTILALAASFVLSFLSGCPATDFQVATDASTQDIDTRPLESFSSTPGAGPAGNLPLGYNQLQCGVDACEGPPATTSTYISNPVRNSQ